VIVVTIEAEPRVIQRPRSSRVLAAHLRQLEDFVRLNQGVLLQYWNDDDMDTRDMLDRLRRLTS
jgi:hypothetical protein